MNIFKTLKFALMMIIVIINASISGFIFYTEKHNDCECGPAWRRIVLKFGGLIIASIAIIAYFTPIISIISMIPLIGGLVLLSVFGLCILMIYSIQKYLKDIESPDCVCKQKNKLQQISKILGWASITTMIIIALVIVFVLFYMF